MGIFSNRIGKDDLKPGDHIYSWRTGYVYSHHGIYVDDNKVIHFTSSDINLTCSVPQQPKVPCLNCTENEAADGVVSSCLDCFLGGCDLYRFEYSVSLAVFLAQVRSGTCTRAHSDPNETAIHRAKCLFDNGFGCYNVFKNNCEDFAIYCKTGLLVVDQGVLGLSDQATSIIGGSLAAVLSMSLRLVTKNVFGMAAVATVSYCANRCATDIARQRNVRKVEVEDLIEGLKGGIMADTNLAPPLFRVENEEIEGLGLEEDTNYLEAESASREEEEEEKESALKEEKDFDLKEEEKDGWFHYPVRSQEPRSDCLFYLRTGTCQFGLNCKFNHPPREKGKVGGEEKKNEHENEKEKGKEKKKDEENEEEKCEEKEHKNEEFPEREGQPTCKYFLKPGGCKFGKACRYNHPRAKARARELVDLNFCGLPIRPGQKECAYYMRTGSCKFETNCRFHHPDPTVVGGCEPLPVYRNDSSRTLHGSRSSPPLPTALSRTSNEGVPDIEASPPPYVPVILPPPHSVHPCAEWNGFLGSGSSSAIIDLTKKADSSTSQNHTIVEEFPERPGQQECQFYMKTGNCKFKSACIYHHPKTQVSISPARCVLSSMGLPLRPDQNICKRYSRFGICNFGPACMYDHPIN